MAAVRVCFAALILLAGWGTARADEAPAQPRGLYDRPVLVIDPGMHTAMINRASADRDGRFAVTGSDDKTVRVWSLSDGALLRTIRLPAGPGDVGKVYAVAMSPDGKLIAAGGWTTDSSQQEQIYLFDQETGSLRYRIEGLPGNVNHLVFSPDGSRLAAALGHGGIRVYARETGWQEVALDENYGDQSYSADFADDGRLATTSYDDKIRLYSAGLSGTVRPALSVKNGQRPVEIAFSPDGALLAVGYEDSTAVDRLDGHTLAAVRSPVLSGIDNGDLSKVAWSRDGATLFAAGRFKVDGSVQVLSWDRGGEGALRASRASLDNVMSLVPLGGDDVLVAAADPFIARVAPDGSRRWQHGLPAADFPYRDDRFLISDDGMRIAFGYTQWNPNLAAFTVSNRALILNATKDATLKPARQTGLPLQDWHYTVHPTLAGQRIQLEPYEMSRSLAMHPDGDRFVLGAEWNLRAFKADGTPLWARRVPGTAWGVNITGNGKLVVAAYSDGTIRWHRMSDGVELLAFMPLANQKDWVLWTPEGFYDATPGAQGILRWQVDHGWDEMPTVVPVADIPGSYRPNVLPLVLRELETPRALGLAVMAEHNEEVQRRTNSHVPPGIRLHLLAVGVGTYEQDDHLHLKFADQDASALNSAIKTTQEPLYTVEARTLSNQDANKKGIMLALASMARHMEAGTNNDLAVVFFAGHGAMVGDDLYLLPYDADVREDATLNVSAISVGDLRKSLGELAKHGRVLVLLDACHSGATMMDGRALSNNQDLLKTALAAANITVLTSSSSTEVSREGPEWGDHGAFTRALLDALGDPATDPSHIGLISSTALATYLHQHVPDITDNQQTPGMEVRFESTVFALAH